MEPPVQKLVVVKIGGNVIDDSERLHEFLIDFAALPGHKILVHGGGKAATKLSHDLGIEPRLVDGRRITDIATLRVVTMVYAGLINKNIVAQLQRFNCDAIGLTGADANLIRAVKRMAGTIDYGYAGDLDEHSVDRDKLAEWLMKPIVPVFSAITHDGNGQLLNTNADTIASALAVALAPLFETTLVYCFEKMGVMRDITDDSSLIPMIHLSDFEQLKEDGTITDGMIPKLHNAFGAISKGVKDVFIGKAGDLKKLNSKSLGTRLLP